MRKLWLAIIAGLLALLLAACGSDAHKGEHCIRSHQETYYQPPIYVKAGSVMVPVGGGMVSTTVCDQWVPDNPATVVPATKKGN